MATASKPKKDMTERDKSKFHTSGEYGHLFEDETYSIYAPIKIGTQEKTYCQWFAMKEGSEKKILVCRIPVDGVQGKFCDKEISKGAGSSNMVTHMARLHPHLLTAEDQFLKKVGRFKEGSGVTFFLDLFIKCFCLFL